ncbi:MAG TPA: head-tail connector protein [Sedimentisphaerales bacterium]|nr:head-tail connector protein [Sedimentisphaerales bacterium]
MATKTYQAGETAVLTTAFQVDGVLTDPDVSIKVTITNPAGTAVVAAVAMTTTGVTGNFYYDYNIAAAPVRGVHQVVYTAIHRGAAVADRVTITEDVVIVEGAVSVADVKNWLRVDHDEDDVDLARLITAAADYCEHFTHRQLLTATRIANWDDFPAGEWRLPYPPLQAGTIIKYYDSGGVQRTVDATVYDEDIAAEPGVISLSYEQTWPSNRGHRNDIEVTFICGYGSAADVPEHFRTAIKLLVAHWYEHREAVLTGTISKEIEFSVHALLRQMDMPEADS